MKLQPAILSVLDLAPRALSAAAIAPFLPQFTSQSCAEAALAAALATLVELGHVKTTPSLDRGLVYTITDEGRARIR